LLRVLNALQGQSLQRLDWELILVDNASDRVLAGSFDLSWHSAGRHVREEELGLTPARLRGIAEAKGEILVFVDDDNVLALNYLQEVLEISRKWPILGAWGGTIIGEYEVDPEPCMRSLLPYLAIRQISKPIWSNNPADWRSQPCGAGMCIRAEVAKNYVKQIASEPRRRRLDRVGQILSSCGDTDLILTSCDLGLGFGNFPQLLLTHLIPASRIKPAYLIGLMQGISVSVLVLNFLRGGELPEKPSQLKTMVRYGWTYLSQGHQAARIYKARQDALRMGIRNAQDLSVNCLTEGLELVNGTRESRRRNRDLESL
jgi:hypothetical protein